MARNEIRQLCRLQAVSRGQSEDVPEAALQAFEEAAQRMERPGAFESRAIAVDGEGFRAQTGFSPNGGEFISPEAVRRSAQAATPAPKPATAKPAATAAAAPNKPGQKGNARDRLDLESTQITGNRELPKVLYIVPWRSAELGDLVGRPVNSLLDEVLEPVDRDVFRRQNRYFEALQPNAAAPAPKPEK
jgi:hypothetical protein